jgi:hypothetical protein
MKAWLAVIPLIGKLVSLIEWTIWKIKISNLEKRKKKIINAEDSSDWSDILNGRM